MTQAFLWTGLFLIEGGPFLGLHSPFQLVGAISMGVGAVILIVDAIAARRKV